ncbi:tetratricopeptide repeat protein [Paenibacillus sanguinis]|uniref:tetratricopeptide repeat protein n=1 Tax=Paenibacillus sanguinis TaxID=225906 RepID=UPI0003799422|nr:tetratricopeptide repeat protein [Paenibacillus sanguinis]
MIGDVMQRSFATRVVGKSKSFLFQFSLNKSWNKKLSDEIKKIRDYNRQVTTFVFVTSQTVTGAARDKFELLANEYGWNLQIYDRTWLRLQLEERHPDMAKKYLAIPDILLSYRQQDTIFPFSSCENSDTASWHLYKNKNYEEAALGFKKWLIQYPKDILAWQGLASCQYHVYQYKEALFSINEALRIDHSNRVSKSIKASILTEDGIACSNRANLLTAKELFKDISMESDHWFDYYNYGNVLSALDEPEEALTQYLKAISWIVINLNCGKTWGVYTIRLVNTMRNLDAWTRCWS